MKTPYALKTAGKSKADTRPAATTDETNPTRTPTGTCKQTGSKGTIKGKTKTPLATNLPGTTGTAAATGDSTSTA
jgi:hypothetical protein